MDIRQAEYLKLLGIQAWCQQEDLPQVQENLKALKLAAKGISPSVVSQNGQQSPVNMIANSEALSKDISRREEPAHLAEDLQSANYAANLSINKERFSQQLQEVTDGLRVNVAPKVAESIAVKSAFEAKAFSYNAQASIFAEPFAQAIKNCLGCDFSQSRHQVTLPRQSQNARVMIITDIPLKEEMFQGHVLDRSDESFFFKAMKAVGLSPDMLYITPFIKCRPPELRDVSDKEWHACFQVLKREILEVSPEMIFLLGRTSVKFLLQKELPFESLRRERHLIRIDDFEVPVVISHSPRVYAKNSRLKANFWQDLKFLRRQLG
ncbi:uracil-DNA glycosylase [Ignatzschineria rhizosphaerae]|uniref:Uracil-DNA glycosylase n=1 Tax=Ignatzschineria rhizosphaerae TaxID=2923279 RepID=A0ABY3X8D4_9GAMM|nr:uracil-DNA glycosylase [Ignatzschineria rhizosphaerae]UNM96991.1 uracil-DNA glycosylase [Ignatzschineria rhizosphaerae]